MIDCLLIHVSQVPQGLSGTHEMHVRGESLRFGRGAACTVHLPDHRVALHHATLRRDDTGALLLEAAPGAFISIDGFLESAAALAPGRTFVIGPYHFAVEDTKAGCDIALRCSLPQGGHPAAAGGHELQEPVRWRKRWLGLGLAVILLLGGLLLPLLTRLSPAFEHWQAALPVSLTGLQSPGPLSPGHRGFAQRCTTCHAKAFHAVADTACTECHSRLADHLPADAAHAERIRARRCADCHPAHAGKAATRVAGLTQCVGCHRQVDGDIAKVGSFSAHPDFHLTVPDGQSSQRVPLDGSTLPPEHAGLKFSHAFHLSKKGISTPEGDTVMHCPDCHQLEDSGEHFTPVNMKLTCQQSRCHTLRYAEPAGGIVPHGSEREALYRLRLFYIDRVLKEGNVADCPPATRKSPDGLLGCAENKARTQAAETLFRQDGENLECALCHEIRTTGRHDMPWRVAPVRPIRDWQPKAHFSHARHGTLACTECHRKTDSSESADISFPRIEVCRQCHTDPDGSANRVASRCESCHRFHRHPPAP